MLIIPRTTRSRSRAATARSSWTSWPGTSGARPPTSGARCRSWPAGWRGAARTTCPGRRRASASAHRLRGRQLLPRPRSPPRPGRARAGGGGRRCAERPFASFRVTTRRSYKGFPLTRATSTASWARPSRRPPASASASRSPTSPSSSRCCATASSSRSSAAPGAGGFPVGTSGRVVALLSGGIDSPVAAWRMMKRGCTVRARPLPRLPPPGPHHHRQGDGAGAHPHPLPVPDPPAARPLRRGAADDRGRLPGAAARRALPALHGAHRGGAGRAPPRQGAGHRREPGPGGLADPRQHGRDRRGGPRARSCARWWAWTRRRSRSRRGASAPSR